MGIFSDNTHSGLPNDFNLEDIKGAAATIVIAGNDTVSHKSVIIKQL
jgi:hypothetical protein